MLSYEHATVCRCIIGFLHQMDPVRSFEGLVKNKVSIEEISWDVDIWVYLRGLQRKISVQCFGM